MYLSGKFPCRTDDQSANFILPQLGFSPDQALEYWDEKSQCFTGAGDGLDDYILVLHKEGYRGCLHWGHMGETHRTYDFQDPRRQRDRK